MKNMLGALLLALAGLLHFSSPVQAQPCQWTYSEPGNVATATYCGNVVVDGSITGPSTNTVATMADLEALTSSTMSAAHNINVSDYTAGSPGGGTFVWLTAAQASNLSPNNGLTVAPSDNPSDCSIGCMVRQLQGNVSPEMFGAWGDTKFVQDCSTTVSPAKVTCASASFTAADVGKLLIVQGAGASSRNLSTTIAAVVDANNVTPAIAPSAAVSGKQVTYGHNDTTAINNTISWQTAQYNKPYNPLVGYGYANNTLPTVSFSGTYLTTSGFTFGNGASIDMTGGSLVSAAENVMLMRSPTEQEAHDNWNIFGTYDHDLNNLTLNCNYFSGGGLDLGTVAMSTVHNPQVMNCTGNRVSGVTGTTSIGSGSVTVSSSTDLREGMVFTIDGLTTADGTVTPVFDIIHIDDATHISINPVPQKVVTDAAITVLSTGITGRDLQQSAIYSPEIEGNDLAFFCGANEYNPGGSLYFQCNDVNIFGGGHQKNEIGFVLGYASHVKIYGYRFQDSTLGTNPGVELMFLNANNNVCEGCYFENFAGAATDVPLIYSDTTTNGLSLTNPQFVIGNYWRRFWITNTANAKLDDLISFPNNAYENPSHTGDFAFVQLLSGSIGMHDLSGFPNIVSTPSKWIVNNAFSFPTDQAITWQSISGNGYVMGPLDTSCTFLASGSLYNNAGVITQCP